MQIQKITSNYNQANNNKISRNAVNTTKKTSFGHRTAYPVFISDAVKAHFYEPESRVFGYTFKIGEGKSIYIKRNYDSPQKELVAQIDEGKFNIAKLPKKVEEYYQECVTAAKGYFRSGVKVEF